MQWVNWAYTNGVIKKDEAASEQALFRKQIGLSVAIGCLIFVGLLLLTNIYFKRNQPLAASVKSNQVSLYLILGCIVVAYALYLMKSAAYFSFQSKIERYLCNLFPHSNNENYARSNIPVSNNVRT